MNLILLESGEVNEAGVAVLDDHRAAHIRDVLRVKKEDTIRIGLVNGPLGTARIQDESSRQVVLKCTLGKSRPPKPKIDLLLALPRPKVLKRLWAPLASMGVGRIMLTNAWKVERNYFDTHVLQPDFFRPLLLEGLQQARDTWLPEVTIHRQLKILVEDQLDQLVSHRSRIMADPAAKIPIRSLGASFRKGRLLLAVGPEGGWTKFERDLLKSHGFVPVGMGPRILRTDIACIALLALAGDLLNRHSRHS
ncbi:MAG: RsmE family RNA methyltransferase [Lentisphaerota bacterium]